MYKATTEMTRTLSQQQECRKLRINSREKQQNNQQQNETITQMNSTENQQNKQQQNEQEMELLKTNSNNQEILLEIAQQKQT